MSHVGQDSSGGRYQIRVKGRLDTRWAAWFDGLALTHETDGTTVIHAMLADQSALHGLLRKVNDIGVPLLSVVQVDRDQSACPTTEPR